LIDEVLALKVPLLGVISDKQESICLAIEQRLPEVPHQLCHYHYLRDVAQPISDADRSLKKQLKQRVRGLREVEIKVAKETSVAGQVVRDYCLTLRTVMREEGKYPLDPAGISLYDKLAAIAASLRRALEQHPSAKLQRLLTWLGVLGRCETPVRPPGRGVELDSSTGALARPRRRPGRSHHRDPQLCDGLERRGE
jgi:hypothetical protein